jgi:hypothetical protein
VIDPSVAVQVTAVLEVPVTAASNCFDWPDCSAAEVGDSETPIGGGLFSTPAAPINGMLIGAKGRGIAKVSVPE